MEPKLIRKDIKYQKKTLIIVSALVISLFIGGSFALLSSSDKTEEVVTFKTGNFDLEVKTEGTLSLEGEVPKSYEDGFKNNDITLTLTNKGSLEIGKYEVKLEGDTGTTLDANYIRYSVSDDEGKTYLASKLLSDANNIIYTGYNLKTSKVLKVKLWIDEAAGSNALKKSYNGKINVELYQNEDTAVQVVKSKLVSNYSGSNESFSGGLVAVNNDGNLYHEVNSEEIREYRYSGASVNNYVTFNDELWRIVGVFKDENGEHIKIVRNKVIVTGFPDTFIISGTNYIIQSTTTKAHAFWNNKQSGTNNNDWTTSGLMNWLNNMEDSDGTKGYLDSLSVDAKEMIQENKYFLGNIEATNPIDVYRKEHDVEKCVNNTATSDNLDGCNIWSGNKATWLGKIGLLYPSDLGYATNNISWSTMNLSTYESLNTSNWMISTFETTNTWSYLLGISSISNTKVGLFQNTGNVIFSDANNYGYGVRPALYLKSNVKITSGDGTQNNPYKLILE